MLKCHLKGKTCRKLAKGLKFYDLKKKLTPGVALTRPWGYIYVYYRDVNECRNLYSNIRIGYSNIFEYSNDIHMYAQ